MKFIMTDGGLAQVMDLAKDWLHNASEMHSMIVGFGAQVGMPFLVPLFFEGFAPVFMIYDCVKSYRSGGWSEAAPKIVKSGIMLIAAVTVGGLVYHLLGAMNAFIIKGGLKLLV